MENELFSQQVPEALMETTTPEPPENLSPRVRILQCLESNFFVDAALQTIGYVILMEAIRRQPEFNRPENFDTVKFDGTTDVGGQAIKLRSVNTMPVRVVDLLDRLDELIDDIAGVLRHILSSETDNGRRVILGTVRAHTVIVSDEGYDDIRIRIVYATRKAQ